MSNNKIVGIILTSLGGVFTVLFGLAAVSVQEQLFWTRAAEEAATLKAYGLTAVAVICLIIGVMLINNDDEETSSHKKESEAKFCRFCGSGLALDAAFCPKCGRKVNAGGEKASKTTNQTNKDSSPSKSPDKSYDQLVDALFNGDINAVKTLLGRGINMNEKNEFGKTVLMIATELDITNIVQVLVDKGANVNEKDNNGETALMLAAAAEKANKGIVQLLLDNGADVTVQNNSGQTAAMMAEKKGHADIVRMLEQAEVRKYQNS